MAPTCAIVQPPFPPGGPGEGVSEGDGEGGGVEDSSSNALMSHLAPWGLETPRWSVVGGGQSVSTASTAGLPINSACVGVEPPLSASVGFRMAFRGTSGTMSVAPGLKPETPASPSCPNRLKLSAWTVL